jgi:tetratricopeptide (TPR) repeat protein
MTLKHLIVTGVAFMAALPGCSNGSNESMSLPPDSPTQSVEAALAFNEGIKVRNTDKPLAIEHYTSAIRADPQFQEAYFNRALIYSELGQLDKADADLQALQELGSKKAATLERLIEIARDLHQTN